MPRVEKCIDVEHQQFSVHRDQDTPHAADENESQLSNGDDENNHMEEFILVKLSDIRKEVQCPICLGIIRKTRTVMECLHRFCRECIDKSMRMGNNECPACRTHCASRRSLRDDPNYDALIAVIYPDIDEYEEEEMSFQEVEKDRNKQIQVAIARTFSRQMEALSKKRKRSQKTYRRRRVNSRSEDEEEANGHDSSSTDEHSVEVRSKRLNRRRGEQGAPSGGGDSYDQDVVKEPMVAPAGLVTGSAEKLAWGKGGIRSNSRCGSGVAATVKDSRSRIERLCDHLRKSEAEDNERDIQVALVSLDEQKQYTLEHSFLCVERTVSVAHMCQYISLQTSMPLETVEIMAAKGQGNSIEFEVCKDELQLLDSEETLDRLQDGYHCSMGHLVLAYRQKAIT